MLSSNYNENEKQKANNGKDNKGTVTGNQDAIINPSERVEENSNEENDDQDNMDAYLWDGPENSDEEIESMVKFKNKWEIEKDVKFSKNGLSSFIETFLEEESAEKQDAWE